MAGISKARRLRFLEKHPYCCFCGGSTSTETEDHIPARSLFDGRQWPEGYVFPACKSCNHQSSSDELLVAWLSRFRISGHWSTEQEQEFERLCKDVQRRHPKIWEGIKEMPRVQSRRLAKDARLERFKTDDLTYAVTIPQELMTAVERYGIKLAKALHFKQTGRIVPVDSHIVARALTNAETLTSDIAPRVLAVLPGSPVLQRSNTPLQDQFHYQYGIVEGGEASAFLISIRQSMVIAAFVFCDRARYLESKAAKLLQDMGDKTS